MSMQEQIGTKGIGDNARVFGPEPRGQVLRDQLNLRRKRQALELTAGLTSGDIKPSGQQCAAQPRFKLAAVSWQVING